MTQATPITRSPDSPDPTRIDDVLTVVAERQPEFEEKRHIPQDVIDVFKRAGIYRASTPKRFGGDPLPPARFLALIERISAVDGSAGWVASFGSSLVYLAALPLETQAELYADGPDVVFAAGLFPVQTAERVEGGYRVSGRWKFASGCTGADVLGVGTKAGEDATGRPLTAVLRPGQVRIADHWNVVGMRGTGSHDVDEPLYRYPTVPYAAQVLAVVGLGVARAALDQAIAAGGRTGHTGVLKDALVTAIGTITGAVPMGTHSVLFATIDRITTRAGAPSLVYFNRAFHRLV